MLVVVVTQERFWVELIAHGGDGHQSPPERLYKGPDVAGMVDLGRPVLAGHVPGPVGAVVTVRHLLLREVDQAGVGEDGHGDDDEEEAELLVGLLESVEQGLEASKVSDQLEYPQYPHHSHQADHLPRLTDDLEVLQPLQQDRQVERNDSEEIDQIHRVLEDIFGPICSRRNKYY